MIPGLNCEDAEGAMYAFPSVSIPQAAVIEAKNRDQTPDTMYALSLLEETGICVVPGECSIIIHLAHFAS